MITIRYRKIYLLAVIISIVSCMLFHINVSDMKRDYDDTSDYETVENNYLTDQFSTQFFGKLNHHGINRYGTCSYIAMIMLLSYYNVYWDDNIIDECYEHTIRDVISISTLEYSPGIKVEPSSLAPSNNLAQYIKNIRSNYNQYFHFMLVKHGLDTFDFYDGDYEDDIYYSESLSEKDEALGIYVFQHKQLLRYYLYELQLYDVDDVKIKSISQTHEINRQFIIDNIIKGHPVVFMARTGDNESGHVMVAYDYDSVSDEIICHMGWGKNSAKTKYSSTAYTRILSAYVLHFHTNHVCSNNYLDFFDEPICPCQLNQEIIYDYGFEQLDSSTHTKICSCGYETIENHTYSYSFWDNTYHKKTCICGYSLNAPHVLMNVPAGYKKCVMCGAHVNSDFGGIVGPTSYSGLMTKPQGSYKLPNGVIILAESDLDAYLNGELVIE